MDNVVRGGNWYFDVLNLWRVLDEVTVPSLKHAEDDFTPGGSNLGVKWQEEVQSLEATIKTKTSDPEIRGLCGRQPGDYVTATWYENLHSFRTGQKRGRVVTMKGLVVDATQASVRGMKAAGVDYRFSNIVFYHDIVDGRSIHRFDFFGGPPQTIVNGANPYAGMAANLAIAGGVVL